MGLICHSSLRDPQRRESKFWSRTGLLRTTSYPEGPCSACSYSWTKLSCPVPSRAREKLILVVPGSRSFLNLKLSLLVLGCSENDFEKHICGTSLCRGPNGPNPGLNLGERVNRDVNLSTDLELKTRDRPQG